MAEKVQSGLESKLFRAVVIPALGMIFLSAALNVVPPGWIFESGGEYLERHGVKADIVNDLAPGRNVYVYGEGVPDGAFRHLHKSYLKAERDYKNPYAADLGTVSRAFNAINTYFDNLLGHESGLAQALQPVSGQANNCFIRLPDQDVDIRWYVNLMTGLPLDLIETIPFSKEQFRLKSFFHEIGHCPQEIPLWSLFETLAEGEVQADVNGIPLFAAVKNDYVMAEYALHMRALGALGLRPGTHPAYDDAFTHATALALDAALRGVQQPPLQDAVDAYRSLEERIFAAPSFLHKEGLPYMLRIAAALRDIQAYGPPLQPLEQRAAELYLEGIRAFAPKAYERDTAPVLRDAPRQNSSFAKPSA